MYNYGTINGNIYLYIPMNHTIMYLLLSNYLRAFKMVNIKNKIYLTNLSIKFYIKNYFL